MSPKVRNLNEGPITLGLNFQHTLIDGKWEMFNDGNKLSPQNTSVNFDLSLKCIYAAKSVLKLTPEIGFKQIFGIGFEPNPLWLKIRKQGDPRMKHP